MNTLLRAHLPALFLTLTYCALESLWADEPRAAVNHAVSRDSSTHDTVRRKANVVAPILKLFHDGKVPITRVPALVGIVCAKGTAEDLAVLFQLLVDNTLNWPAPTRVAVLQQLATAATERNITPACPCTKLQSLISPIAEGNHSSASLQLNAIRLASRWHDDAIVESLSRLALSESNGLAIREAAIASLGKIGDRTSQAALRELAVSAQPRALRYSATAAWGACDVKAAAQVAARLLIEAQSQAEASPMFHELLSLARGPEELATAFSANTIEAESAKSILRSMQVLGHNDERLSKVLFAAAGIPATPVLPTQDQVREFAAEAAKMGDAHRGEEVFRRTDMTCITCHSVCRVGGQVGPELSAVGATSPIDYIVTSILNPNLQKKEAYETRTFVTSGTVVTGIVVERNASRVQCKDATGAITTIPIQDIEEEFEGRSLMPEGLTTFLTRQETLDLMKFVSELGKPGPYACAPDSVVRRWMYLRRPPVDIADRTADNFASLDLPPTGSEAWVTIYGPVSGTLRLRDLQQRPPTATPDNPRDINAAIVLRCELIVTEKGEVGFDLQGPARTIVEIGGKIYRMADASRRFVMELPRGRHSATLLIPKAVDAGEVDKAIDATAQLRLELFMPSGSRAQFTIAVGP